MVTDRKHALVVGGTGMLRGIQYRRIQLGRYGTEGQARWLTDDEISAGVIGAIKADHSDTLVGGES